MKTLILLRHAKSSWADVTLDDHDRPLNRRGMDAAPVIGAWLAHRDYHPDVILCSSSRRTRQTVELMRSSMPSLPEPQVERKLYHSTPSEMLYRLATLQNRSSTAMLVGHQPGIGSFLRKLSDGSEKQRCHRAFEHFPTAAAAVLELPIDAWADLTFGIGQFVDFAKPRELVDA